MRTICFLKSRRGVELIQQFARLRLEDAGRADLAERIAPYRAGYTPAQRREIERRLAEGELLAVVATDALELGIDVGDLDAAICVTFPGTVASLRQMWGRAGPARHRAWRCTWRATTRSTSSSAATPTSSSTAPVECGDPRPRVRGDPPAAPGGGRLRAAADARGRARCFGPRWQEHARRLVQQGELRERDGRYLPRGEGFPAARISLRSASPDSFAVVEADGGEMIGTVEAARAHSTVHPGAVYLHLGEPYEVEELDLTSGRARGPAASTATGTRSRRRRPRPSSRRCATSATRSA